MSTNTETPDTGAQRRFKYTRELIKIAREDMTQEEIAKLCRVNQSVVSGWANGSSRAKEHQVAELLRRYGHRLNRVTSKVYLALREAPTNVDWMPTRHVTSEKYPHDRFEPDADALKIVQVEGPITMRHTLHFLVRGERARRPVVEQDACYRWLVHHQGRDRFVLARQQRRAHLPGQVRNLFGGNHHPELVWVSAADDSACWLTHLQGPMSAEELLAFTDAQAREPITFPDRNTVVGADLLPFLVRKMLVELGYTVPGVERISASR